ncbi:MAG: enoyl-CoA hydratase/isomerase family protein [Candidatus Binatia bacterium]
MSVPDDVLYEVQGCAAWITLNAPERRNALSAPLLEQLEAHLHAAMADEVVRVAVLTGNGPAFCAGADLKAGGRGAARGGQRNSFIEILRLIWEGYKPVIAAVNGHAFGGGLGFMAAADIAIAANTAKFAFSEVRIGVIPAMISVVVLPKLGVHHAMRLFLTGETFTAADALGYGLVHRVVEPAALREAAQAAVDAIALGGPNAMREVKRLVRLMPRLSAEEGFAYAAEKSATLFASDEAAEGMSAFAAKRHPKWAK